ncbi:MAG: YkgJ family cysteine cluster protein [archaeon]|nr:YkgJ family cysteine cluster protein [archaeon]
MEVILEGMSVTIKVDYSGITGKMFECIPECGMCCLCQPEILPEERSFFEAKYPEAVSKSKGHKYMLSMRKGKGSCVFLDKERRCSIYKNRTTFCRQFPFHFYVGDRISAELDLSCRGVWTKKGRDAAEEAKILAKNSEKRLLATLEEASAVYRDFYSICREAGIMQDVSTLRESVRRNEKKFTDYRYIAEVMNLSMSDSEIHLDDIHLESNTRMSELEIAARDSAIESMSSRDPMNVPVYCDENWNWNVFFANRDAIRQSTIDCEGDIHWKMSIDVDTVRLKNLDDSGRGVLIDYIRVLNSRDSFLGSVFSSVDEYGYEDNVSNAYCGSLCVSIIDLLWRASMLDCFFGTGMGARGIREAIIFYDMDRLDAPTIGAVA